MAPADVCERGDLIKLKEVAEALGILPSESKDALSSLCLAYLTCMKDGRSQDDYAHIHLSGGATILSLHWRADETPLGMSSALSFMVGYAYDDATEASNACYYRQGEIPSSASSSVAVTVPVSIWPEAKIAGLRSTNLATLGAIVSLLKGRAPATYKDTTLFVDLGSGEGHVVRAVAAELGWRGVGVELDDALVAQSNVKSEPNLSDQVRFVSADLCKIDLGEADVVFLYMPELVLQHIITAVFPQNGLRQGALIVIEATPRNFLDNGIALGLRHVRSHIPTVGEHSPRIDLFEWIGVGSATEAYLCAQTELMPLWPAT